jgi:hypothetical protein
MARKCLGDVIGNAIKVMWIATAGEGCKRRARVREGAL